MQLVRVVNNYSFVLSIIALMFDGISSTDFTIVFTIFSIFPFIAF